MRSRRLVTPSLRFHRVIGVILSGTLDDGSSGLLVHLVHDSPGPAIPPPMDLLAEVEISRTSSNDAERKGWQSRRADVIL